MEEQQKGKRRPRLIPADSRLVPAKVASRVYGVAYGSLRDAAFRNELPVIKVGRAWYFERADIDRWLERHKGTAA